MASRPELDPTKLYNPAIVTATDQTALLIKRLTIRRSSFLMGTEWGAHNVTGRKRILSDNNHEKITLSRYKVDDQAHMGDIVSLYLGVDIPTPKGHIEFQTQVDKAGIEGALYITAVGVVAAVHIEHDRENPFSAGSSVCYEVAKHLGLGEHWSDSLYQTFGENPNSQDQPEIFALHEGQINQLNNYLENFMGQA